MVRYIAAGAAALLLGGAAIFWANTRDSGAAANGVLPALAAATPTAPDPGPLPDTVPEASAKTREERRFGRYDKDKDGTIAREEYLASRRKAFAKLDTNGDGALSFEEWAIRTTAKFAGADRDRSGALTRDEFATTAVVRKARPKPKCVCPPQAPAGEDES